MFRFSLDIEILVGGVSFVSFACQNDIIRSFLCLFLMLESRVKNRQVAGSLDHAAQLPVSALIKNMGFTAATHTQHIQCVSGLSLLPHLIIHGTCQTLQVKYHHIGKVLQHLSAHSCSPEDKPFSLWTVYGLLLLNLPEEKNNNYTHKIYIH